MSKNKKYISNIKKLCQADIKEGRRLVLETRLKECIKNEDYETCQGITEALNDKTNK